MDVEEDDRYARPPQLEDLVKLCRSLNDQGVKYILIGGFAVILHGAGRTTKDIDLLIDPSGENIQKLKKAMAILPDNAISSLENDEVQKYQVVRIADEFVVDLMAKACGIDYERAREGIVWLDVNGVKIPVAGKEWLIRMKDTIRLSDKADIFFLRTAIEEERDGKVPSRDKKTGAWNWKISRWLKDRLRSKRT